MPSGPSTQRGPEGEPQPAPAETKRDLVSWWKSFKRPNKREDEKVSHVESQSPTGIFGVPLQVSIRYANVAISLLDQDGRSFIYGYVPIVVAKCGVYLKDRATDVEGIFRLAGAERRIKELQALFNSPERYGKQLDWTGYTVHDAANVLRRYINLLPEPIVPLEFYARFREPLRNHQAQAVGETSGQGPDAGNFDAETAIKTYQQLITELPPLNRQLLLYLLDLLAVFAAKSDVNLMTAHNLSSIFQPGLIHDPMHNLSPAEYRLSQDVLIFLIEKQDHFLVGMQGTAADEKTIQEVQNGSPNPQKPPSGPSTPKSRTQQLIVRSASVASVGSESVRRLGALRRNVSVSSRNSRQSNNAPSPVTPPSGVLMNSGKGLGLGVHRSNTVPSKKSPSPALGSDRFARASDAQMIGLSGPGSQISPYSPPAHFPTSPPLNGPTTPGLASVSEAAAMGGDTTPPATTFAPSRGPQPETAIIDSARPVTQERQILQSNNLQLAMPPNTGFERPSPATTPGRERSLGSLFRQTESESEKKDSRKPHKLQKRRIPEAIASPTSSTNSPGMGSQPTSPMYAAHGADARQNSQGNLLDPQTIEAQPRMSGFFRALRDTRSPDRNSGYYAPAITPSEGPASAEQSNQNQYLQPGSYKQTSSLTGSPPSSGSDSSHEHADREARHEKKEKRSRWRLSSPGGKRGQKEMNGAALAPTLGGMAPTAERSTSTIGSIGKPRQSLTDDSYTTNASAKPEGDERTSSTASSERKGAFGWFKDRLGRSKSPAARGTDVEQSKQSLSAVVTGSTDASSQSRGRSVEAFGGLQKEGQGNQGT